MEKENLYAVGQIRTRSGQYVNVFEPDPATIIIEDIAHALSHQCRFGGHLPRFYTVAQHSYECMQLCPAHRLTALMHDASEAYLLDIPKPIKAKLTNYAEIENRLMQVIAQKFGFAWPMPEEVKFADHTMLEREWYGLMLQHPAAYMDVWSAGKSRMRFLEAFKALTITNPNP
jgi:hypothetical protein